MVSADEDIHQSLQILLRTRRNERPMNEAFGSSLSDVVFEEADHALLSRIRSIVTDAILEHETRIKLHRVDVTQADDNYGVLRIRLDYTVVTTNSRFNMVYPFYLNEASALGY